MLGLKTADSGTAGTAKDSVTGGSGAGGPLDGFQREFGTRDFVGVLN